MKKTAALWLIAVSCATAVCAVAQSPIVTKPVVTKVEPPNWWANYSINPVRLLLRGERLRDATLTAPRGFAVSNIRSNERGTYLFADLKIPATAMPGSYPLTVTSRAGSSQVPFQLAKPLSATDNFRGFSNDDVIYLLMPDRFANGDPSNDDPAISHGLYDRTKPRYYHGGDIAGIIQHLPYFKELGVTAIWTTPIYDNNNGLNDKEKYDGKGISDYHGYGAIDYYGVEEHLGTLDLLRKLVVEAHKLGIKVIQDQVSNHVGPYHPWVADPPLPTWFHGTAAQHINETWQVWTLADPNASAQIRRDVTDGWFIDILPDMNQEEPEVRQYEIQNTLWWLGAVGFDGIRQDTWPYVSRAFWHDWMAAIKQQYPSVTVVGEIFDQDPALESFFQGGREHEGIDTGLDSVFDFPAYYRMRDAFGSGKPVQAVANVIGHDYLYPRPAALIPFLANHDTPRFMNDEGSTIAGLKLAFTCLLTLRGIPLIYYGDEIAMSGGGDPDNRRDFPGGWHDDPANAFTKAGRTPDQEEVFEHVKKLTALRASDAALRHGELKTLVTTQQQWVYARRSGSHTAVVAINNDKTPAVITIPLSGMTLADGTSLRGALGVVGKATVQSGQITVSLPARSAEVFVSR